MVKDGNLAGILDWEASGYFPVWWEFACAGIGLGQDDFEWKGLRGGLCLIIMKLASSGWTFMLFRGIPSWMKEGRSYWRSCSRISPHVHLTEVNISNRLSKPRAEVMGINYTVLFYGIIHN
jgi:hypothetical protein